MNVENMNMEDDTVKDNYELKGKPRRNPYAERMKNGYSIIIRYNNGDKINLEQISSLAEQPGLKTLTLHFNRDINNVEQSIVAE